MIKVLKYRDQTTTKIAINIKELADNSNFKE